MCLDRVVRTISSTRLAGGHSLNPCPKALYVCPYSSVPPSSWCSLLDNQRFCVAGCRGGHAHPAKMPTNVPTWDFNVHQKIWAKPGGNVIWKLVFVGYHSEVSNPRSCSYEPTTLPLRHYDVDEVGFTILCEIYQLWGTKPSTKWPCSLLIWSYRYVTWSHDLPKKKIIIAHM